MSSRRLSLSNVATHAFVIWSALAVFCFQDIDGACTFPSQLTGSWVRSRDSRSLTFTSNTVTGLNILFNGQSLGDFTCDTLSSGRYILASSTYLATFGNSIYYICWQLVSVSDSAYILYELSDNVNEPSSYAARPGSIQSSSNALDVNTACSKSTSTTTFTTLVKSGASSSDVAVSCPSAVQAIFKYGSCSSSSLESCSDSKVLTADYTACSDTIFTSTGGIVSCMGSAVSGGSRYVNLFKHDSGNDVVCWKIPDSTSPTSMSTTTYSSDCSLLSSPTTVSLTLAEQCPESEDSGGGGGGGGDGAVIGGAAGGALIAIAAVAVLGFLFIRKKKQNTIIDIESDHSREATMSTDSDEKKVPETDETADESEEASPRAPKKLPPLGPIGTAMTGTPLRT